MSPARFGQHFLVNAGIVEGILARAAPGPGDLVVEVGPGRGVLTEALLERAGRVLAVEIDERLLPGLAERFGARSSFELRHLDAVRLDWSALAEQAPETRVLFVANLPYEAAAPILLRWLEASCAEPRLERAVVMVQLEMARRLAAGPGSKDYGSLGALAQCTHEVAKVVDAAPGSFRPPPKVRSRVVELRRRDEPALDLESWRPGADFIHAAFAKRRKQLATALGGTGGLSREDWQRLLTGLGRSARSRAEELDPETLLALARAAGLM